MNTYFITSKTPILIYGYTEYAKEIVKKLEEKMYLVKGYIDKNAEMIDAEKKYPIYLPEQVCTFDWAQEVTIILGLQNIITHISVANSLYSNMGLKKIVFLPATRDYDYAAASIMRQIYQKICLGEVFSEFPIPEYGELINSGKQTKFIFESDKWVEFFCPALLLFSGMKDETNSWQYKNSAVYEEKALEYEDNLIAFNRLYDSFFEYMITGNLDCTEYIELYAKVTNKSVKDYYEDRVRLFKLYEDEYLNNTQFFLETPAMARWNARGYFNLQDGHHRVAYLLKKGWYLIPVIVSKKDYLAYRNKNMEVQLLNFIVRNKNLELFNSEFRMRLYGDNIEKFYADSKNMISILKFLRDNVDIKQCSVLDLSGTQGFVAANLSRVNAKKIEIVVENIDQEKLIQQIFKIVYQKRIHVMRKENVVLKYDVVFAGRVQSINKIKQIESMTEKFLFFESEKNCGIINNLGKSGSNGYYKKIEQYFDNGIWIESGVLIKNR